MYTHKYIQRIITRAAMLSLLTLCITAIHAQQQEVPDMSKFSKAPIKQGGGSSSATRVAATPARVSAALPSDQPAQASATTTGNNRTMKPVNKTAAGAPAAPGMEQMNMQPAPEKVKPKQQPVKVPTQQN